MIGKVIERIEQAKQDWRSGKFDPVPEETEFIPLPEEAFSPGEQKSDEVQPLS